jgi:outer membrane lipoprotein-sorting protein
VKRVISSVCISALLLLAASCAQTQKVATEAGPSETVVSSTPPFQTKEPERYRATRTVTTVTATGETLVNKNWIARDGELRRDETESEGLRVAYLTLQGGKPVVLLPEEKLFADLSEEDPRATSEDDLETSPLRLLHTDPLATTYQRAGAETIGGRNTQKYRVVVNSSPEANVTVSETVIWVDEALQMPIKTEMKSASGSRSTMELSDIVLEADQNLFRVPEGYKKITFTELLKRLKMD